MNDTQPGLSGALFVFEKNKKAGAEDGKAAIKKIRLQTD